jgi:AAA domain
VFGVIPEPVVTMSRGLIAVLFDGGEPVSLTFDNPRTGRDGGLSGELRITVGPDEIHHALTTISSIRGRAELAGYLGRRCAGPDWPEIVDRACRELMATARAGEPPIDLRLAPKLEAGRCIIDPLVAMRHPTVWFGPGGAAKSLLALAVGATLESGYPFIGIKPAHTARVLYCDWEMDAGEHADRLARLAAGAATPMPRMDYLRGEAPIWHEADRIRRAAIRLGSEFAIVDSISAAISGPLSDDETATSFYGALRRIGLPALCIAHQTKAEQGDQAPFGSVMWRERARLVWYLRAAPSANSNKVPVAFYPRKNNLGALAPEQGFTLTFDADEGPITVARSVVADSAELGARLPTIVRVRYALRSGAKTYAEIAGETGDSVDTVSKAIRRANDAFVRVLGPDGVTRWGLAA